jgi:hypothetical protein
VPATDYEALVGLAAKGMRERDSVPMPVSVTTPAAFYKVMARAALDAIELQSLLEVVVRLESKRKVFEESLRRESISTAQKPLPGASRGNAVPCFAVPSFASAGLRATRPLGPRLRPGAWRRRLLP